MPTSPAWPAWAVELLKDRESARLGMGKEGRKHVGGRSGCGLVLREGCGQGQWVRRHQLSERP